MINQLEHVTEHGLNLDDQITDIMRPVAHNVEEMVLQAAHSMLLERYRQQGWKVERHPAVSFKTLHGEVHIKSPYLKKDGEVHGIRPMLLHFGVRGRGMSLNLERTLSSFTMKIELRTRKALHPHRQARFSLAASDELLFFG